MLNFTYIARDPATGKKIQATVEGESEQAVAKTLKDQGLSPIEIKMDQGGFKQVPKQNKS